MNTFRFFLLACVIGCLAGCGASSNRKGVRKIDVTYRALPSKSVKQTTEAEALQCKAYYKEHGNLDLAAKYLEHALSKTTDHHLRKDLILELADMYMELGSKDKASKLYAQYKTLYPGSPLIKYVLYQEVAANYGDTLASTKDQTKTKEVIKLAQAYLEEFPDDVEYTHKVRAFLGDASLKLLRNEFITITFYLHKYTYAPDASLLKATKQRLSHVIQEYFRFLPDNSGLLKLNDTLHTLPDSPTYESLKAIANVIEAYLNQTPEAEDNFFTRLFTTSRRHGQSAKKNRA